MFSEVPYECLDTYLCATTSPGSDDEVWSPLETTDGYPIQDFRVGYFETEGEMYAPCLEWDDYIVDFNNYKIYYGQEYDVMTYTYSVLYQPVMYLCWEGRAVSCNPDATTGFYLNDAGDNLTCIEAGDPETAPDSWTLEEGMIGEVQESFADKFPHCLPNTEFDSSTATSEMLAMVEMLTYKEIQEEPALYMYGYYDETLESIIYWTEEYGEELPIYVDRYGNLCTNMDTEVDAGTGRVLLAFNDGIFDMTIADIDETTAVEDYPTNVANIASFLSEDEFNIYTANQKMLDGVADDGTDCTECVPFTTYWDFMSAVAKAPGFCGGEPGSMYGRFEDE